MVTLTRSITVAAGVFAPGHLGELTQIIPFELVDAVLEETGRVQRRLRLIPSRVALYQPGKVRQTGQSRRRSPSKTRVISAFAISCQLSPFAS
jgi:hypothetical protein